MVRGMEFAELVTPGAPYDSQRILYRAALDMDVEQVIV